MGRECSSWSCGFAVGRAVRDASFTVEPIRSAQLRASRSSKLGLVGARGFEPPTPASRTQCATGLRYAPTCEPTDEERDSVLQQDGGKRQAMRFGHSLTCHLAVVEIDSFGKTWVRTNGPLKAFRGQAEYEG